jgi:hypothetical protein
VIKELTGAGTPHVHFIVVWPVGFEVPTLTEFRKWNDDAWADVVCSSHPSHRDVSCRVSTIRSWDRLVHYFSGYLTKGVEGQRQCDGTGRMWRVVNRKLLPRSLHQYSISVPEFTKISRALIRHRQRCVTWLISKASYSGSNRRVCASGKFVRAARHPWYHDDASYPAPDPSSFEGQKLLRSCREDGFRLRRVRLRGFRREVTENVWVCEIGGSKLERSPVVAAVLSWRLNKVTGQRERVMVDEVNDVPMAWHYLPSSEALRLLAFVRRDGLAGLTACERRWVRPPG